MKNIILRYTHSQRGSAVAFLKALHEEFTGRFRYRIGRLGDPPNPDQFFNWVATRRREHITFCFYMKDLLSPSTSRTMGFTDEFISKAVQNYVFVIQHNESVNEYEPQSDSVILTEEQLLTFLRANTKVQQNPMDYLNFELRRLGDLFEESPYEYMLRRTPLSFVDNLRAETIKFKKCYDNKMAFFLFKNNYSSREFVGHCKANMNVARLIDHIKWDESPMGREYWQCLYQAFHDDYPLNEGDDDETPQHPMPTFSSGYVSLGGGWRTTPPMPTSSSVIVNDYSISIADELSTSISDALTETIRSSYYPNF
jgi:hypothetical protein